MNIQSFESDYGYSNLKEQRGIRRGKSTPDNFFSVVANYWKTWGIEMWYILPLLTSINRKLI